MLLCGQCYNNVYDLEPVGGALLSTLRHATVYVFTQFAACTGTDPRVRDPMK
jgi:hypothetical protein